MLMGGVDNLFCAVCAQLTDSRYSGRRVLLHAFVASVSD